jgi:hypothetical protein
MEARGKQELWIRQKPEVLEVLREQAIIQSAESSNRIEKPARSDRDGEASQPAGVEGQHIRMIATQ